jgi:uncharacterized metal-binding protein YceD (DUF177 family)
MTTSDTPRKLVPARLPTSGPTPFRLVPTPEEMVALITRLDLLDLRKVRFEGALHPQDKQDWHLTGSLGATVVQPCSITLKPVTTRVDVTVDRLYLSEYAAPTETEAEMPEDDSRELLPESIDLLEVLSEALALELPDFPRAEGAELGEAVFSEPETTPLTDEAVKPFAGLAALKSRLEE